jgi:hypothetical protein
MFAVNAVNYDPRGKWQMDIVKNGFDAIKC